MSEVEDLRKGLLMDLESIVSQSDVKYLTGQVDAIMQAVRDEEFKNHELKEDCRWNGGHGTDGLCTGCPLNGSRYCA